MQAGIGHNSRHIAAAQQPTRCAPKLIELGMLLAAGASVKSVDTSGISILHWDAFYGKAKSVQMILQYGSMEETDMPSVTDGPTRLCTLCRVRHLQLPNAMRLETQNLLIDASKSLNVKSLAGDTALSEAIQFGNVQAVDRLLLRHADPNFIAGAFKQTPS